jgi:hypothetical protein
MQGEKRWMLRNNGMGEIGRRGLLNSTLTMNAASSSETLVSACKTTHYHNAKDYSMNTHCLTSLKFYMKRDCVIAN